MPVSVLIVEDDPSHAERLKRNLQLDKISAVISPGADDAVSRLRSQSFDLVITDIKMPEVSGLELIRRIRKQEADGIDPDIPIVVVSSVNDAQTAVEAMQLGANDYINKEAPRAELVLRVQKVLERSEIANENRMLKGELARRDEFQMLVGESEAMQRIKEEVNQIADSDVSVMITGETGVGKELVARAIHRTSPKSKGPFVDVNCAALPDENLFQSEVFGHEKGAFTDALYQRKGKFELAHRGTLFLDEIAELSRESQGKILKALEQQMITRLGGTRPIEVDCRFIFATNKDLLGEVQAGTFREDLYYRINVFPIHIPPLRERKSDIPMLGKFFADHFARKYNRPEYFFEESAMAMLRDYHYPGNIRELRNIIERLVIRSRGDVITRSQVEQVGLAPRQSAERSTIHIPEGGVNLEQVEQDLVLEALNKSGWNQKDAAALLGISVDRMNSRVRKYGLKHPKWRVHK